LLVPGCTRWDLGIQIEQEWFNSANMECPAIMEFRKTLRLAWLSSNMLLDNRRSNGPSNKKRDFYFRMGSLTVAAGGAPTAFLGAGTSPCKARCIRSALNRRAAAIAICDGCVWPGRCGGHTDLDDQNCRPTQ
jgi:hypothetical protein